MNMDDAAREAERQRGREAERDLANNVPFDAVEAVGTWFAKHYLTAGHKRLIRATREGLEVEGKE